MLRDALQAALGTSHTIEGELTGGGMSTVFVAYDGTLDRRVVVKVLHADLAAGVNVERFRREIRTVAQLVHPHIVPLLSAGEADGLPFYTMPLLEGESLRARLRRDGFLPVAEVLAIAKDVADALDYANRQGVVHRDIKPENVILHDGSALVTDFGIAKAVAAARGPADPSDVNETSGPGDLTALGAAIGTPAYMSPEQASGDPNLDGRADVYSLGCMLYELLVGEPPYRGNEPHSVIAQHFSAAVPRIRARRGDVPVAVDAAIAMAMAKEPSKRFATVAAFRKALVSRPGPRVVSPMLSAAVAVLVIAGTLVMAWSTSRGGEHGAPTSLAVLPLVNASGDTNHQYFIDGMTDEITGAIARLPGVRVSSRSGAAAAAAKQGGNKEVARRLNVGTLLEGRVRREGSRMRLTMQLSNASDGLSLWTETFNADVRDAFAVQDEIARRVAEALRIALAPATARRPVDPAAHDLVLRGRFLMEQYTPQPLREAVALFERAIAIDSTYVEAWASLADAWARRADVDTPGRVALPHMRKAVARAMALDSTRATVLTQLAVIRGWIDRDVEAAEQTFLRALAADSSYDVAHVWYAALLSADRRPDSAVSVLERLGRIDPVSRLLLMEGPTLAVWANRADVANAICNRALETDSVAFRMCRYPIMDAEGRHEELLAACRVQRNQRCEIIQLSRLGRIADARRLMEEYERERSGRWVRASGMAGLWAQIGDVDRAMAWLEREAADSGGTLLALRTTPTFRRLHGNARFEALAERVRAR